jgi:D-beta-D-heptose 7-phosphate kinase/D-beta-D-heptose 1-phosphate adenosyltransferase
LITPNRLEAFGLAGLPYKDPDDPAERMELLRQVAAKIDEKWAVKNLLITLSAEGMGLFRKGQEPFLMPTVAREVFDVSGAGDTVIATYTLFKACGASDEVAMHLSNIAAGIVVGRVGTVTTNLAEMKASLKERM